MTSILFVNHNYSKVCGIYAHGTRMYKILKNSKKYKFYYSEVVSFEELNQKVNTINPEIIIYNYTPILMPWINEAIISYKNKITNIALCHDITPESMTDGMLYPFDYKIALDPTLPKKHRWFTSVRPSFGYFGKHLNDKNDILTIGSFGFYFPHKNFNLILVKVKNEFKKAKVKLHLNTAYFSPENVKLSMNKFIEDCYNYFKETDLVLEISTGMITDEEQIDFLSKNDINIFPYSNNYGMGPSSAIDYAVAAGRPIMISNSYQFRHIVSKVCTIDQPIKSCIEKGNLQILQLRDEWSEENFLKDYERIIYEVQNRQF